MTQTRINLHTQAILCLVSLVLVLSVPVWAAYPVAPDPEAVAQVLAGERPEANAAWWGFDPEDSTEFLQAALDSGAERVIIPNMGADWVVRPLYLRSNQEVIFEKGVVITAKPGEFHGRNDSVFSAWDVDNVILWGYGATIRMQKEDYRRSPYERAEWRMGIQLRGARNVHVLGFTVRDTGGDGIYVDGSGTRIASENIVIRDVIADNNYRQGISVISVRNLLVENSVFSNTEGTPPMAGIDLEPDLPYQVLVDIVLRNNRFEGNQGAGIMMYLNNLNEQSEPISIVVENNTIVGNATGIHLNTGTDSPQGEIIFRQNVVTGARQSGVHFKGLPSDALRVVVADMLLKDISLVQRRAPIQLEAGGGTMRGVVFRNVVVADNLDRPALYMTGGRFNGVTGEIRVLNWHGARSEGSGAQDSPGLSVRQRASQYIYYGDTPGELVADPVIHFGDLDSFGVTTTVSGDFSPNITLRGVPKEEVSSVFIYLDDELIFEGDAIPAYGDILIDTLARNLDKRPRVVHELKIRVDTENMGRLEDHREFAAINYWRDRDDLEGPAQTWFGPLYHAKTYDESAGWEFALGDADAFHGDPHRRIRAGNTTEYLVWETPLVTDIEFTVYAPDPAVEGLIEIAVSGDGEEWLPVAYTATPGSASEAGWYLITLRAELEDSAGLAFTRLTLRSSEPAAEVQVGGAIFVGRVESSD